MAWRTTASAKFKSAGRPGCPGGGPPFEFLGSGDPCRAWSLYLLDRGFRTSTAAQAPRRNRRRDDQVESTSRVQGRQVGRHALPGQLVQRPARRGAGSARLVMQRCSSGRRAGWSLPPSCVGMDEYRPTPGVEAQVRRGWRAVRRQLVELAAQRRRWARRCRSGRQGCAPGQIGHRGADRRTTSTRAGAAKVLQRSGAAPQGIRDRWPGFRRSGSGLLITQSRWDPRETREPTPHATTTAKRNGMLSGTR